MRRAARITLADAGLAAAAAIAFLAFCRFTYQGISGQRVFTTPAEIVLYFVLPAAAAALFLTSLRLNELTKLRTLLATVAGVVAIYTAELFLTVSAGTSILVFADLDSNPRLKPLMAVLAQSRDKPRYGLSLQKRYGRPIDIRNPREVIQDLRRRGVDAVPIVTASNQLLGAQADGSLKSSISIGGREVLPLGGVSRRVTLLCNESGQWVDYRSDRHGFNNPDEVWQSRIEIAALGDSFTHGYCVPSGSAYMDLIRRRYPATLNLGIAGDGPLLMLATLNEYVVNAAPRFVLWFYYEGNDLTDLQRERKSPLLKNYLREGFGQPDLARQDDIDRAIIADIPRLDAVDSEHDRRAMQASLSSGLVSFAKLTAIRDRLVPFAQTDPEAKNAVADFESDNLDAFRAILVRADRTVAGWHGRLLFIYLPEWTRYTQYSSWGKAKRETVLRLVRSLGIEVVDIDPVFRTHRDPLSLFPFRAVGHYTEEGHRLVADEVIRRLEPTSSGVR